MGKISSTELTLVERVGSEGDVAGSAQLLVRNETPNKFIARNDAGDEQRLGISLSADIDTSTGAVFYDITGIPTGVRHITMTFFDVSVSGTSPMMVQLGTVGGPVTTGYVGTAWRSNTNNLLFTTGIGTTGASAAAQLYFGAINLYLQSNSTNTWSGTSVMGLDAVVIAVGGGGISLASDLAQIRLTTVGGVNTFDNGNMSIQFT